MDLLKKKQSLHKKRLQALKKQMASVKGSKKHKLPFDNNSDDESDGEWGSGSGAGQQEGTVKEYMDNNADYADTWFDDEEFVQFEKHPDGEEELTVEFDVAMPDLERDFDGVQLYLRNYLRGAESFNYAQFTELIMGDYSSGEDGEKSAQRTANPCTSVLKIDQSGAAEDNNTGTSSAKKDQMEEDDDDDDDEKQEGDVDMVDVSSWEWNDIYGVISCLDMHKHKNAECVKQVVKYVLDRCPDVRLKTQFREILLTNRIGLIVNERVVNLPVEVSPILHDNLHEEIQTGIKNDQLSLFQYYLILSRVYYDSEMASVTSERVSEDILGRSTKKKKITKLAKEQKLGASSDSELNSAQLSYLKSRSNVAPNFYNPEEEFYHEKSKLSFTFPLNEDGEDMSVASLDRIIRTEGIVMLIERDKMPRILKTIHRMFDMKPPSNHDDEDGDDSGNDGDNKGNKKKRKKQGQSSKSKKPRAK